MMIIDVVFVVAFIVWTIVYGITTNKKAEASIEQTREIATLSHTLAFVSKESTRTNESKEIRYVRTTEESSVCECCGDMKELLYNCDESWGSKTNKVYGENRKCVGTLMYCTNCGKVQVKPSKEENK